MQPRTKKITILAGVLTILVIIGVVVGVVVSEEKKKKDRENADNTDNAVADPTFPLDDRLHKSFWGAWGRKCFPPIERKWLTVFFTLSYSIAYTPYGALHPTCGATIGNVTKDIQQLSQLTPRIRLYAADCNVTSLILQAIEDLQVDLDIYPGIYLHAEWDSYSRQKTALDHAFEAFGTEHVLGITVGNEYLLNANSRGDNAANATRTVLDRMAETRNAYADYDNFEGGKGIKIGTSDAGGQFLEDLVVGADFIFANIHPWFSENTVDQAAWFAQGFFKTNIEPLANLTDGRPVDLYQGEIGWPSGTDDAALGINFAGSPAGIPQMQTMLDTWVCPSNANGTKYFWFAAYDEPWKGMYGGVEAHWGLFDATGNLKDVTIPDCPVS